MIIVVPLSGALYRTGISMAVIAACACRHPTATSLASSFLVTTTTLTTSALATTASVATVSIMSTAGE